jgi:hypothetical protein
MEFNLRQLHQLYNENIGGIYRVVQRGATIEHEDGVMTLTGTLYFTDDEEDYVVTFKETIFNLYTGENKLEFGDVLKV